MPFWVVILIELSTVVACPVHVAFQYLANFENLPEHEPAVEKVTRTSMGPVGVGSTWTHVRRMGRRRIEAPITLVEYEPDRRLAILSDAEPVHVRALQVFESTSDGSTRVSETLEMRITGAARLFEPVIRVQARRQAVASHQGFKAVLEGSRS